MVNCVFWKARANGTWNVIRPDECATAVMVVEYEAGDAHFDFLISCFWAFLVRKWSFSMIAVSCVVGCTHWVIFAADGLLGLCCEDLFSGSWECLDLSAFLFWSVWKLWSLEIEYLILDLLSGLQNICFQRLTESWFWPLSSSGCRIGSEDIECLDFFTSYYEV